MFCFQDLHLFLSQCLILFVFRLPSCLLLFLLLSFPSRLSASASPSTPLSRALSVSLLLLFLLSTCPRIHICILLLLPIFHTCKTLVHT